MQRRLSQRAVGVWSDEAIRLMELGLQKNPAVLRTDWSGIGDFCVVLLAARPEG